MNKDNFDSKAGKLGTSTCDDLDNIKRTLTMLEKALDRLLRQNYHNPNQYPQIVKEMKAALNDLRAWFKDHELFDCHPGFISILGMAVKDLGQIIGQLIRECKASAGKKDIKKNRKFNSRANFADQLILCWSM